MNIYRKRVVDQVLAFKLEGAGAVLVEGVRRVGTDPAPFTLKYRPAE